MGTYLKGPVYKSHSLTDTSILVEFETHGGKLVSKDKYGYLRGFAIAGKNGEFKWAKAELVTTNTVKVYHENIKNPKYVRYAWSDNPGQLDLTNAEGLPAFPFRTDSFELGTSKKTYQYDPHAF